MATIMGIVFAPGVTAEDVTDLIVNEITFVGCTFPDADAEAPEGKAVTITGSTFTPGTTDEDVQALIVDTVTFVDCTFLEEGEEVPEIPAEGETDLGDLRGML